MSDYIVSFLIEKGITDVFGYPGGMVTHLMDSFQKYSREITAHVNYHEQGSAFCACGYAQVTGLPGVAYATSGPGATNLVTGIANAYFDSIPCIFLTGQVNTYEAKGDLPVRQKGFQETDILSIVTSITKYAVHITRAQALPYELEKAFFISTEGRRGPVLLDIPMDVQRQEIDPASFHGYTPPCTPQTSDAAFSLIWKTLDAAKRPCLLVGAGVKQSGMVRPFQQLAEALGIPVVSSMLAVDVPAGSTAHYYGFLGAYGDRKANFILAKSDWILAIGTRLDGRQIGSKKENFAPLAQLIRLDVDTDELANPVKDDEIAIACDIREAITWLLRHVQKRKRTDYQSWLDICDTIAKALHGMDANPVGALIRALSDALPEDAVITTDVGQNQVWIAQYFTVKKNQRLLFSGGHGAMGYSLPAAIGAQLGSKKPVFCFSGDGGIQMNLQELQVIAREQLPIKIVVLNNNALGMIRHFQEMYFDSRFTQTVKSGGYAAPSFAKIAAAYQLRYQRIETLADCRCIRADHVPELIEVCLPETTYVFPKLAMNKPNQDQEPLMDRAVYERLMSL